jgi:hypothetical protein
MHAALSIEMLTKHSQALRSSKPIGGLADELKTKTFTQMQPKEVLETIGA